jgi:S1-C subfamily serine protease
VDLERTGKENAQRGVSFTFYDYPMISDPGPVLAPDSYAPPCPAVSSQARQGQSTSPGNGQEWFGATGSASDKGLAVSSVRGGSPAEQLGLQAGDVVVRVDCRPIRNAQDVDSALAGSSGTVWVSYLIQGAWMTDKKIVR